MRETQKYAQVLADNFNAPLIGAEVTNLPGGGFAYGPMGALCGQVLMGTNPGSADSARTVPVLGDSPATSAAFVDSNAIAESLRSVHRSNIAAAQAQLKVLADQTVANTLSPETFNSTMNSLVQNYQTQLRDTAHSTYTAQRANLNGKLVKGMVDDGWAMAGMYYVAVVRAQDEITRAITQTPATASGELWGTGNVVTDAATQGGAFGVAKNFLGNAFVNSSGRDEYLNRGRAMIKQGNATNLSQVETIADQATGDSWVMKVVSWFMNDDMTFFGNQQFAQQGQNPIIMAKNLGENMTAGAWTALAIGGSVLALSGADILGTGIGDWATVFTPVLFALFAMFVVPGATLSTYVPMIPYILWVGVIIGWVILVVEAVIASPIWAVAHMAPDGDGVVGRGGQGYMLVLSLTLRPPLMILGLACSISLMKPIGYFVNSTFLGAFAMGVNPGPLAITQAIAGCVLYAVVMVGVVHRVFTLIHLVPDRILRWIGGGGNELGDQAGSLEQSSAGKTLQAMHSTQQIGNLSQGALQGSRDLSRKKADAAHAGAIRGEETRSRMAQQEANVADNAYRAGLTAETSSSRAEDNPSVESYNQAALDNEVARNSQLGEGENKLDHYMQQSGAEGGLPGGLNQLRSMPMAQRQEMAQNMAETNPQMARAIQFANNLDQARSEQRSNPSGNAMASFINSQAASVSANGASGSAVWEVSAAQSKKFEDKRQQFVQGPPPPPGGGDQPT
jgi:conjugal transfer/type IV secretion protein DotA/TraY